MFQKNGNIEVIVIIIKAGNKNKKLAKTNFFEWVCGLLNCPMKHHLTKLNKKGNSYFTSISYNKNYLNKKEFESNRSLFSKLQGHQELFLHREYSSQGTDCLNNQTVLQKH